MNQPAAETNTPIEAEELQAPATDLNANPTNASGEAPATPQAPKPEETNGAEAQQRSRIATANFGEIVALLSFSPQYKHLSLADLEWLVLPALATNQVTTVRGKLKNPQGLTVPLGLALWAHVSAEIDKKLQTQQQARMPFRLAPQNGRAAPFLGCWLSWPPRISNKRWSRN